MNRFLWVLLLFAGTMVQAQQGLPDLRKLGSYNFTPAFTGSVTNLLPFKAIRVSDQRFDTSKAGYKRAGKGFQKVEFNLSIASTIERGLNRAYAGHLDKNSDQTLWIYLKHYFIQETSVSELKGYKITMLKDDTNKPFHLCQVTLETYLEKDAAFTPLFRLDTSFTTAKAKDEDFRALASQPFDYCMERLSYTNIDKLREIRKPLSFATVEQYYNKRFASVRLQKDSLYKGIYLTYQDFLNNKVAPLDYELTKNYLSDQVYILQNGKPVLITDFWGFCDGEKDYINIGLNVYELVRTNNTYELWGSKAATHDFKSPNNRTDAHIGPIPMRYPILVSILTQRDRMDENLKPLQLNMETGKVY
jgi:hypothetical protein